MTPHADSDPGACRRVCEELLRHRRVVITSHMRPDGDSVGSSLALAWALRALGIEARVIHRDRPPLQLADFPGLAEIEVGDTIPSGTGAAGRAGVFAGRVLFVDLVDELLDARVLLDRLVEAELELRHAAQAEPAGELPAHERHGALQRLAGVLARLAGGHRRVVDARDLKVGREVHARHGDESHAGVMDLAREDVADLFPDLVAKAIGAVSLWHRTLGPAGAVRKERRRRLRPSSPPPVSRWCKPRSRPRP